MRVLLHCLVLAALSVAGCGKNPGTMGKSEVEAELKTLFKFKDVALEKQADGSYTGTGTAEDGSKTDLTVTQDEKQNKLSYKAKNAKGVQKTGFVQQQ